MVKVKKYQMQNVKNLCTQYFQFLGMDLDLNYFYGKEVITQLKFWQFNSKFWTCILNKLEPKILYF